MIDVAVTADDGRAAQPDDPLWYREVVSFHWGLDIDGPRCRGLWCDSVECTVGAGRSVAGALPCAQVVLATHRHVKDLRERHIVTAERAEDRLVEPRERANESTWRVALRHLLRKHVLRHRRLKQERRFHLARERFGITRSGHDHLAAV